LPPPIRDLRKRRQQILIAALALRRALRRLNLAGDYDDRIRPDIGLSARAHHNWIEAAPFSAISSIGMRLEPRIGAAHRRCVEYELAIERKRTVAGLSRPDRGQPSRDEKIASEASAQAEHS
jgi:hypothetical protein